MKFELKTIKAIPSRVTTQIQIRKMTLKSRQKGASALEYIVLVGAIAVVLAGAVAIFGGEIDGFFEGLMTDIFGESTGT